MATALKRQMLGSHRIALLLHVALVLFAATVSSADKTAADYYVKSLPGAPAGPLLKMHAGYV